MAGRRESKVIPMNTVGNALNEAASNLREKGADEGKVLAAREQAYLEANRDRLRALLLDAIRGEVENLLATVGDKVVDGFSKAYVAHCEDEPETLRKWKYRVGLGVTIQPLAGSYGVTAACRYGMSRKHVSDGRAVQLQLPMRESGS